MKTLQLLIILLTTALFACNSGENNTSEEAKNTMPDTMHTVEFPSKDSLTLTADIYPADSPKGVILMFHQARYSRGEYREIAPKVAEKGFICIAVDLRSGKEIQGVKNETAARFAPDGKEVRYLAALPDVEASIDYVKDRFDLPIILWGSSYSASLSLIAGKERPEVEKVIAFSAGDYFGSEFNMRKWSFQYGKPILACYDVTEEKYMDTMVRIMKSNPKTTFVLVGDHGSKALWGYGLPVETGYKALYKFLGV